jgi:hypothetical protein
MARPLEIEYPAALFPITAHGNERRDIFADDHDREVMLVKLGAIKYLLEKAALGPYLN